MASQRPRSGCRPADGGNGAVRAVAGGGCSTVDARRRARRVHACGREAGGPSQPLRLARSDDRRGAHPQRVERAEHRDPERIGRASRDGSLDPSSGRSCHRERNRPPSRRHDLPRYLHGGARAAGRRAHDARYRAARPRGRQLRLRRRPLQRRLGANVRLPLRCIPVLRFRARGRRRHDGAAADVEGGRGGGGPMTTRVLQLDLAAAPSDVAGLEAYDGARVLVRYGSHVVGEVYVPVREGTVTAASVSAALNGDQAARARLSAIIVVDNAPATDATERIAERYPVRYVRENAPGLNRARALGARTSNGDIVIYTDDDTVAEPGWVRALVSEFGGARVGGATGLTMPLELETEAQELFERYGGFSKGFFRQEYDVTKISPSRAGAVGSGASMAFRRDLILSLGLFDVELDLGTASRTGGDTYALYRLLAEGYRIVYTPAALNWHQHRREHDELHTTMAGYGTGLYAFLTRALVEDHEVPALRVGMSWFRKHHLRELARAIARRPNHLSIAMVMAEIRGTLVAPIAYLSSRRAERARASENVGVSGKGAA